ncbi:Os09g0348766 [Oryza sativa Japonica Group]|uniref:Os09g0348766 protein n=1 Tax=Oryza sativa subsp. japonica TaxID=39947 RepID=A0A0P0XKH8_ORYSJ|nr:hypothetical protein EE612_047182 [Oryza sativa]BAT07627.1 Os09g0348766 [Oryza sativa Japonica Group]
MQKRQEQLQLHLADGPNVDVEIVVSLSVPMLPLKPLSARASSNARLSFNCTTTAAIVGLWAPISAVHNNAMSTTFHIELTS